MMISTLNAVRIKLIVKMRKLIMCNQTAEMISFEKNDSFDSRIKIEKRNRLVVIYYWKDLSL